MELLQHEHQHYIRKSDFLQHAQLDESTFRRKVEMYTFDRKPLECVELHGQPYLACKSAFQFLEWHLDRSYGAKPCVNDFKHSLTKYAKKIPKRVLSRSMRIELAYRQQYKCAHCKILLPPDFEVDHVTALEDGGQDIASNLQCLCVACHSTKTRLNRLRKHNLFAAEAEHEHAKYTRPVQYESEGAQEEEEPPVFSKYFRQNN